MSTESAITEVLTPQPCAPLPLPPLALYAHGATVIGQRPRNEDAFIIDESQHLYLVADGMGGMVAGDRASRLVVDAVRTALSGHDRDLAGAIQDARDQLVATTAGSPFQNRMGTTIVGLVLDRVHHCATVAHVGDSRAYRLRAGLLDRLTADHNVPGELLAAGRITEAEAERHPLRNVLTRCLSSQPLGNVDVAMCSIAPGDHFLLCSDGLTVIMNDDELRDQLMAATGIEDAAARLLLQAQDRGAPDNATVVVVEVRAAG